MAKSKRTTPSKAKPTTKPVLQNLAARPTTFDDDPGDEQLVDHSGVFRVTTAIKQAQTGHDEEATLRFASDSLVMAAQRDGFREETPTLAEAVDEQATDDEAASALKRQRLATLAARHQAQRRR